MSCNGISGGNPRYGQDPYGPPPVSVGVPGLRAFPQQHMSRHIIPPFDNSVPYYCSTTQGPRLVPPYFSSTFVPSHLSISGQPPIGSQGQGQRRQPQLDGDFRTCNMRNSTGGFGCEPGYNYFFPSEHTKIHVLKTGSTPPWQLPANFAIQFHACHVPVNTTVAELMKGFGAKNSVPKMNVITEVCPGGGGRWYKGIELRGDDYESMKLPIKELGWDATRTGLRGEKKVVYIYVQKD